jgi:competence protein ComEA
MLRALLRLALLAAAVVAVGLVARPGPGRLRHPADLPAARPADSAAAGGDGAAAPEVAPGEAGAPRVHLNRATRAELEALPGIGPALAGRILEFRASHGPFRDPSELLLVRGIGPKRWAALKPLLAP